MLLCIRLWAFGAASHGKGGRETVGFSQTADWSGEPGSKAGGKGAGQLVAGRGHQCATVADTGFMSGVIAVC